MRTLTSTLEARQKQAPLAEPRLKVEIKNKRGSVVHLKWSRLYTGSESDDYHDVAMPGDGSLIRIRIGSDDHLYRQRVTSPDENSNYSNWTDMGAVRGGCKPTICASGANVLIFWCHTDNLTIKYVESTNNGGSYGAVQDLVTLDNYPYHLTASMKPNGDVCLIYFEFDAFYARKRVGGSWTTSSQKYEHYDTGDDGYETIYGDQWRAQTFGGFGSHVIGRVRLKLYRVGSPGDLTVSIQEIDDNDHPTGGDLCSGTINGNILTTDTAGAWYEITLGYGFYLDTTKTYAIVARALSGDASNCVRWRADITSPTYTSGNAVASTDGGSTWASQTDRDLLFEEYSHTEYVYSNPKNKPNICNSLAVVYHDDWNVLVTGRDTADDRFVWLCVLGDGTQATLNTWTALQDTMAMASTSYYRYKAAFIDYLDTFRPFWVEMYDAEEIKYRNYWSHSTPNKDFIANLWREPIPFNLESQYGIAITHSATHAWLSTPYGVWRASREVTTWDITNDVVEVRQWFAPERYRSRLKVVLDNTAGTYSDFDKLGYEMILYLGYLTSEGNEYSPTPSFWITGWKFRSPPWFPLHMIYPPGVIGTLEIEAEDIWEILKGWKARRPFEWAVNTKTVKQLLEFVLARGGFELGEFSSSTAINNFKPEFEIREGYNARWAVKKLLSWVEDVLIQRDSKLYLKKPASGDGVDYTYDSMYGNAHLVYRGNYGVHQWDPNRAQVWGTNIMVERFEWDQVDKVFDKLSRVEKPTYPDTTRAAERADAELRKGEMWEGAGGWAQIPVNCGQEIFDVIQVTDYTAGVTNLKRRVLGIYTTYRRKYWHYMQKLLLGLP